MDKKWFRKEKLPVEAMERHACPNCGQEFQGYYCPSCGQSETEFNRPFGFVFYDFMGNFFSFDSRFFHTFRDLLLKPGHLTNEFLEGKRVKYAPPLKIFIFLSFILFLLLEILTGRGLKSVLEKPLDGLLKDSIQASVANLPSRQDSTGAAADSLLAAGVVSLNGTDFSFGGGNISELLESVAGKMEEKLQSTSDPTDRRQLVNTIAILRSPGLLMASMLKYTSWAAFIMLPVFALFLKLFYLRRRVYYIRHLLFSVHTHSFMFLLLSVVLAFLLIFPSASSWFLWILILIPLYIYVTFLKVYHQGYGKTLLKFLLLSGIYGMLLVFLVTGVFVNALLENIV